ncbi:MAG TPA: toprim domain-containing protein, partial [Pseudomonadales bacterium]|nr:toprim domain-containing protein [Pseudomonadales bacterium]
RLSPLDGVGADELALDLLWRRLAEEPISEVILATSATIEGEATSHFIAEGLRPDISVTRIAQGVPLGGELEYVDAGTLARALSGRKQFERF